VVKPRPPLPRPVLVLAAAAAAALLLWWWCGDSDERRIRSALDLLADTLTKRADEPKLAFVGKARTLDDLLTHDVVLRPGEPLPDVEGRDKAKGLFLQAWRYGGVVTVRFADVTVRVEPTGERATSRMTVTVTHRTTEGDELLEPREVVVTWRKLDDAWLVERAERVAVFR